MVVAEIHERRMAETVEEIRERFGGPVLGIHMDIADRVAVDAAVTRVAAELGPVSILVNNPSDNPSTAVLDMTTAEWDRTIELNLSACWYLIRAVVPGMKALGRGSIVNISSPAGWRAGGAEGYGAYGLTKAAIHHLTATVGASLGPSGIRCNAIALGVVRSRWTTSAGHAERYAALVEGSPLGRMIEPEEVAELVSYLVSERSAIVNGAILDATGGLMPRP